MGKEFTDIVLANGNPNVQHFICEKETKIGYYVQDLDNTQNAELFKKGIQLICKYEGKRGEYMVQLLNVMAIHFDNIDEKVQSKEYCHFIAFVCDIALHDKPKLAHKQCYDKNFKKYVANLFWNYYMDKTFEYYKQTNVFAYPSVFHC